MAAEGQTVRLAIGGPIARADLPGLCERLCALLEETGATTALCDLSAARTDVVTVDALARLQLAARRRGCHMRLQHPSGELLELVAFIGLTEVLPDREAMICRSRLRLSNRRSQRSGSMGTSRRDNPGVGEDLTDLRSSVSGAVLSPDDAKYEAARRCFNALVDRRPAVIVRCRSAADVATAFDFARTLELEVAVRGGGHNPAGHCVCDDGLVIDLSQMRAVEVDADARIARAEGGATWVDFDSATQAYGLVTPGGVVGSTGVGGLTLGGGIGHLTAQHGLTCDNLVAADLVTPDGLLIHTSPDENADLLWALRGGGGNFGVATRLDFRLRPLDRVVGGLLTYGGEGAREGLRRFRDVAASAPADLSCQAVLALDASLAPTLVVAPCYTGSEADPKELRLLRSATGTVADNVREQTFLDQQQVFDSPYGENRHYWKGHFARELPDELIDELLARIVALGRPPGGILIESLHGAPKVADATTAAVGFRRAAFNISATASWQDPDVDDEHIGWARETAAAIEPWSLGGGYVNYMQADEPIERVRAAFGEEAFDRLRALKNRYDPDNILHRNQNVPPL